MHIKNIMLDTKFSSLLLASLIPMLIIFPSPRIINAKLNGKIKFLAWRYFSEESNLIILVLENSPSIGFLSYDN